MMREAKNYNEILGAIAEAMLTCKQVNLQIRIKHSDTVDGVATPLEDKHDLHFEISVDDKFDKDALEKVLIGLLKMDCYGYGTHSYEILVIDKA